jgi:F plasmid transfer operon protein TraF
MRAGGTAFLIFCLAGAAAAQDWIPIDSRTRATGHAGVAFAEGPAAAYWNPSSLARYDEEVFEFTSGVGFSLNAGLHLVATGDILADINHLGNLAKDLDFKTKMDTINAGGAFTEQDVQDILKVFDATTALGKSGQGALASPSAAFDLRVGPISIFAHGLGGVGIRPVLDYRTTALTTDALADFFGKLTSPVALSAAGTSLSQKLQAANPALAGDADVDGQVDADELAFQSQQSLGDAAISNPAFQDALAQVVGNLGVGGAVSLKDSNSGFEIRTLIMTEAGVSVAIPLLPQYLTLGVSIKEIVCATAFTRVTMSTINDDSDAKDKARDDFKDSLKRTNHLNFDLGATFMPLEWLMVGVAGRNLIPMNIAIEAPEGHLRVDPMWRLGLAVSPIPLLKFGVDVDLTENDSPLVDGYSSRILGGGLEIDLPVLKIRGGIFNNLAESGSGVVYTAGLGLEIFFFSLDLAGEMSSKRVRIEDPSSNKSRPKIPSTAGVSVTLAFQFEF